MAEVDRITPDILRQLLRYDPDTGALYWRTRDRSWFASADICKRWNNRFAGKPAFTAISNGYLYGTVVWVNTFAHRVAWMMSTGERPVHIDHINGIKTDNRLVNLRAVTPRENAMNARKSKSNASGISGVSWWKGKWRAYIVVRRKQVNLGRFDNLADAAAARKEAEVRFGFHPNHGLPRE